MLRLEQLAHEPPVPRAFVRFDWWVLSRLLYLPFHLLKVHVLVGNQNQPLRRVGRSSGVEVNFFVTECCRCLLHG